MAADDELRRDAAHVDYEVWMLMETATRMRTGLLPADEVARRALLESWLLHVRVLLEFFTTHTHPDDLRASDFFDGPPATKAQIEALAPAKDSQEDRRSSDIHKALAHLVQNRDAINTAWNEWDLGMVTAKLKTFFELLDAPRRLWFPRASRWFAGAAGTSP